MSSWRCGTTISSGLAPSWDTHVHRRQLEHPPDRRRAGRRRRLRRAHHAHRITRGAHRVHRTRVLRPAARPLVVDGVEIAGTATISADVTDDDTSEVLISETGGSTQVAESGGSDTVAAVLATHPYADVTVTLTAGADCLVDGAPSKSVVIPADQWDTRHRLIRAAGFLRRDRHRRRDRRVRPPQLPHPGVRPPATTPSTTSSPTVTVTARVVDDDIPAMIVDTDGGITVTEGGLTDTFTAVLGNEPEADVVVEFPGAGGQARTDTRDVHRQQLERPPDLHGDRRRRRRRREHTGQRHARHEHHHDHSGLSNTGDPDRRRPPGRARHRRPGRRRRHRRHEPLDHHDLAHRRRHG